MAFFAAGDSNSSGIQHSVHLHAHLGVAFFATEIQSPAVQALTFFLTTKAVGNAKRRSI